MGEKRKLQDESKKLNMRIVFQKERAEKMGKKIIKEMSPRTEEHDFQD